MHWLNKLKKIISSGQSRAIFLTGNIHDMFYDGKDCLPLIQYLQNVLRAEKNDQQRSLTHVISQLNHEVEMPGDAIADLSPIWAAMHAKEDNKSLEDRLAETKEASGVYQFEFLRQLSECARNRKSKHNLLMVVEGADILLPESEISRLNMVDRKRIAVVHDWLCEPTFTHGHDTAIFLAESASQVNSRISKLPQVVTVEIPLPGRDDRQVYIDWYKREKGCAVPDDLVDQTSGLSLHAVRQLLCSGDLSPQNISAKVEEYMVGQLGEGVVEFKRPAHLISDCMGNTQIKRFFQSDLLPGIRAADDTAMAGCVVCGPIGAGKTYLCEAVAGELGIPVITLKNIRSKWFGETDQIFERLRRLLESFHKIVVFVDEADTQFGDVQSDHDTERRLTGKIQAMMSDPQLVGKVFWFLMTARIHRLSADIRRPGRMDLIIPILDPEGADKTEFIRWAFSGINDLEQNITKIHGMVNGYSAADYKLLKSQIKRKQCTTADESIKVMLDILSPDIRDVRVYQTMQAKLNTTRASLLYNFDVDSHRIEEDRNAWQREIKRLEEKGIR